MRDWPGRQHVETLRLWPVLVEVVGRIEARPDLFAGAILLGSLSHGEGDAISDVDLVAPVPAGRWDEAWTERTMLSPDALVRFDRVGERPGVGGHSWLTPDLIKVECLVAELDGGGLRLAGDVVVLAGDDSLPDGFERRPALTREFVDDYARTLREERRISDVEIAYGDLIRLLRREVRGDGDSG